jgi:TonB family protein
MDNQTYKNAESRWVEERIASLAPPLEWKPDAAHALERVMQGTQPALSRRWLPLSMVGAILAATAFVLVLLPWHVLWTPESREKVESIPSEPKAQQLSQPAAGKTVDSTSQSATAQFPAPNASGPLTSSAERKPETKAMSRQEVGPQTALALEPPPLRATAPAAQQGNPDPASQANVTEPVAISKVPAQYTQEARDARIQGTVALLCIVKPDGTVTVESVQQGLGYGLDESARWAVEQWQFIPGKKDGMPVQTSVTILVNFSLKKK